jgi:dsRNA-specific ribonuclease
MLTIEHNNVSHFPKEKNFRENELNLNEKKNLKKNELSLDELSLDDLSLNEKQILNDQLNLNNKNKKWHTTLNPNNILISKKEIQDILLKGNIKIEINDLSIWQQAFVHKSYISKNDCSEVSSEPIIKRNSSENIIPLQEKSNERLEWLGDAKLQGSVSYYLWERYPEQDEGFLTKLRSKLVKTKNLSFLAKKLGLSSYLLISYHVEFGCQGRTNPRILENTFESFIGSMFVDFSKKVNTAYGYEVVRRFIITIIEKYVDMVDLVITDENSKDQLMWYFQKNFNGSYPIYLKEKYENECFYIFIKEPITETVVGQGHARSKKQAEQNAAKNALTYYITRDVINKKMII